MLQMQELVVVYYSKKDNTGSEWNEGGRRDSTLTAYDDEWSYCCGRRAIASYLSSFDPSEKISDVDSAAHNCHICDVVRILLLLLLAVHHLPKLYKNWLSMIWNIWTAHRSPLTCIDGVIQWGCWIHLLHSRWKVTWTEMRPSLWTMEISLFMII